MSDASAIVIAPGAGEQIVNPIGGSMCLKVRDQDTSGNYSIHDNTLPPHSPGPRPHRHLNHDETFYVIGGTLTIRAGEDRFDAHAGSFVVIPRGVVHQPSNNSDQPVHVLLVFSPGGMDQFFVEAARLRMPLQAVPQDSEVADALDVFTRRYGYEFAGF